ncbi:hypothetical protein ACPPVT_20440 [Angustibacter sp. McL0619]|uniref:hypothetical protein n=1 Tax=Angustibacter sp. McL0619 TaxID=3415676 RepID=UPI003CF399A6
MVQQTTAFSTPEGYVEHAPVSWWWVPAGLVAGGVCGVLARGWMRYISDDPEFSWTGTLFIVVVFALAGATFALVDVLRRRRARSWRMLLAAPALLVFVSPGMIMLPPVLLGGFALSGRGPGWLRALVGALATAFALGCTFAVEPRGVGSAGLGAMPGFLLLCAALAAGWSLVMRRRPGTSDRTDLACGS